MGESSGAYVEVVLPIGADVFVSGCRESDRLVPCHDGADAITSTLQPPVFGARRRHELVGAVLAIGLASVAAAGAWQSIRRKKSGAAANSSLK